MMKKLKIKNLFLLFLLCCGVVFSDTTTKHIEKTTRPVEEVIPLNYKTIKTDINNLLYKNQGLAQTKYGLAVFSTALNKFIYTKDYQQLLTPASNTKLFTTFTSFYQLGQDYKLTTSVYIDGDVKKGVLNGNIYIVGGGDPIFNLNDLESIAAAVRDYGITKINGNVYGDGSFFDGETNRFIYSKDKDEVEAVAPITALSIEKNIVTVIVTAGTIPGKPVNVQFKPASSGFVVANNATVASLDNNFKQNDDYNNVYEELNYNYYNGDSYDLLARRTVNQKSAKAAKTAAKKAPTPTIKITTSAQADGKQSFTVSGTLGRNKTYSYQYYIKDPVLIATYAFKDRLNAVGVQVSGNAEKKGFIKTEMKNKTLVYAFKRDIKDIINTTNKYSNNYLAESLFKLNGAAAGNDTNTAASARMATINVLKKINSLPEGFLLNDGSGLSRRNLVTAESLVNILLYANNHEFSESFHKSLSIAGCDGTLLKRMKATPAENNLHAKTGTLRNVSSLAGYVDTKTGDRLVFAFVFNGPNVGNYKLLENQIGELLSNY